MVFRCAPWQPIKLRNWGRPWDAGESSGNSKWALSSDCAYCLFCDVFCSWKKESEWCMLLLRHDHQKADRLQTQCFCVNQQLCHWQAGLLICCYFSSVCLIVVFTFRLTRINKVWSDHLYLFRSWQWINSARVFNLTFRAAKTSLTSPDTHTSLCWSCSSVCSGKKKTQKKKKVLQESWE